MPDLFDTGAYTGLSRSALFAPDGRYRYWLTRSWAQGGNGKSVCFVMLNPSRADCLRDDPTIVRCMNFVRRWGYSSLCVRNLFALVSTWPQELLTAADPVGPANDFYLAAAKDADLVIAAWGAGVPFGRDREVLTLLSGKTLLCLGVTKDGHPKHPLRLRADLLPVVFEPTKESA